MHCSGVASESSERLISMEDVASFARDGADIILMPAPGTVPGITLELVRSLVGAVHREGKLAMTSIGTSQEGADTSTIRAIALMAKQAGTDIHHIGDTGFIGIALPENITKHSIAIQGIRLHLSAHGAIGVQVEGRDVALRRPSRWENKHEGICCSHDVGVQRACSQRFDAR